MQCIKCVCLCIVQTHSIDTVSSCSCSRITISSIAWTYLLIMRSFTLHICFLFGVAVLIVVDRLRIANTINCLCFFFLFFRECQNVSLLSSVFMFSLYSVVRASTVKYNEWMNGWKRWTKKSTKWQLTTENKY